MVKATCQRVWEVEVLRQGRLAAADAESFARHCQTCEDCRTRVAQDERLRYLGSALLPPELDEVGIRRRRMQMLREAARRTETPRPALGPRLALYAGVVLAATVMSMLVLRARRPALSGAGAEEAPGTHISAAAGASWNRHKDGAIEYVELDDGVLLLQVRHQRPGERFIVDLPDGELEVKGTRFEVRVRDRQTVAVRVFEGIVVLRRNGFAEQTLRADDSWYAPEVPTAKSSVIDPAPLPASSTSQAPKISSGSSSATGTVRGRPPRVASKVPSETASPDVAEEFDAAMQLYRAHRYADAAAAFHTFASSHGGAGEEEDAAFLEALSLARATRVDAAAFAAESFLERFPRLFHGKDAAILVARGARDRGDCEKARAVLERWLRGAPSADVTAALGRCSP